jgi:hypothetical protein
MMHTASILAMPSDTFHTAAWKAATPATHCGVAADGANRAITSFPLVRNESTVPGLHSLAQ